MKKFPHHTIIHAHLIDNRIMFIKNDWIETELQKKCNPGYFRPIQKKIDKIL